NVFVPHNQSFSPHAISRKNSPSLPNANSSNRGDLVETCSPSNQFLANQRVLLRHFMNS
ncbi:hypothetical protein NQZ68_026520, partial [Dissostichus eleginoides]